MDKTIEYVLEVARCGGIAKAARNLYITPSALSKFIIQKEKEIGVRLFVRQGNRFTLTYPGERYVEMLKEEAKLYEKMKHEMARLADLYSGRMRVGFQMSFAELMTGKVLPMLQDEYPSINVFMEENSTSELLKMLKKKQLDVILSLIDETDEDLVYDRIVDSPVVIAAAKDSPLSKKAAAKEGFSHPWISSEDLINERIIFDRVERSFRRYAGYLLDQDQMPLHSDITVTNARTALMCVKQDLGIIVLPEILVHELGYTDQVAVYSFGNEQQYATLAAVSDPKTVVVNEVKTFSTIVKEIVVNRKVDKS